MNRKAAQYLRVSTDAQTTDNQRLELYRYCERQGWKNVHTYEDNGISGSTADRPALKEMLGDASRGRFDVLVVWKVDRLARSTVDLLRILQELKSHGVDFVSSTQAIDTTTSYGKMVFTFLGAIAEFERETIVERVRSGLNRARADGVRLGRPRVAIDIKAAMRMRDHEDMGYKQIARALGVPRTTVYRTLRAIPKTSMA